MSPVWIIEGTAPATDPVAERNAAERKFAALVDAVRRHERELGSDVPDPRPQDNDLYHRLHEICGEA